MKNIAQSIEELVGSTPLLRLLRTEAHYSLECELLAKLEYFNPAGSAKDRIALNMLLSAEARGDIAPGTVIIEPTSGNTGIALAAIGVARGYRVIIVMPENMSLERQRLIRAYGAEVILSDASLGMSGSIELAYKLGEGFERSYIPNQFENPDNPRAHYSSTGAELWRDTDGDLHALIAGVGTGGTLSGCAAYLKEKNPKIRIIAVEPSSSPLLSEGRAGAHGISGIGANFVPRTLDCSLIDEIMTVSDEDAAECSRAIAKREGLLVGISSGAALSAAIAYARRADAKGQRIAVILPDGGERYLSTSLFE